MNDSDHQEIRPIIQMKIIDSKTTVWNNWNKYLTYDEVARFCDFIDNEFEMEGLASYKRNKINVNMRLTTLQIVNLYHEFRNLRFRKIKSARK